MTRLNSQPDDLQSLADIILQRLTEPGDCPAGTPGLTLHRRETENRPESCFNQPLLALTVQGSKRTVAGSREFRYGAGSALLAGVDMPTLSYLTRASPEQPYLVVSLQLDISLIAELAGQLNDTHRSTGSQHCTAVLPPSEEIHSAFLRLLELPGEPHERALLEPVILQALYLQLLTGRWGAMLQQLCTHGSVSQRISRSINWLRENFIRPLDVEQLASQAHMAPSTFRRHFRSVTSMSPTAYHRHMRLYEAQRLMLENNSNVSDAGYAVGYESRSQFSREYRQLFGAAPQQNISELR